MTEQAQVVEVALEGVQEEKLESGQPEVAESVPEPVVAESVPEPVVQAGDRESQPPPASEQQQSAVGEEAKVTVRLSFKGGGDLTLFVGNLPDSLQSEDALRQVFESCGPIGNIRVNKVAHFAFIEGVDEATSDRCVALHGIEVGGKVLRVEKTGATVKPAAAPARPPPRERREERREERRDAGGKTESGDACYFCGEWGHFARSCPNKAAGQTDRQPKGSGGDHVCYKCGKPGHFAKDHDGDERRDRVRGNDRDRDFRGDRDRDRDRDRYYDRDRRGGRDQSPRRYDDRDSRSGPSNAADYNSRKYAAPRNVASEPLSQKPPGCRTIFVGNLEWDIQPDKIYNHFAKYGAIKQIMWLMDRRTGNFKRCGFLEFYYPESVDFAVEMNGQMLGTLPVRVDFANNTERESTQIGTIQTDQPGYEVKVCQIIS